MPQPLYCREVTNTGVALDIDYLGSLGPATLPAFHDPRVASA